MYWFLYYRGTGFNSSKFEFFNICLSLFSILPLPYVYEFKLFGFLNFDGFNGNPDFSFWSSNWDKLFLVSNSISNSFELFFFKIYQFIFWMKIEIDFNTYIIWIILIKILLVIIWFVIFVRLRFMSDIYESISNAWVYLSMIIFFY